MRHAGEVKYSAPNGGDYKIKVASPPDALYARRLENGVYRVEECVLFKRCPKCKEHWPADTEFFYSVKKGDGLNDICKACYLERRYPDGRKGQQ